MNPKTNFKEGQQVNRDIAPDFGDIHMENVVCSEARVGVAAHGDKGMVHDVTIQNSTFFCSEVTADIDEACDVKLTGVVLKSY